jgi:hypothetical protein
MDDTPQEEPEQRNGDRAHQEADQGSEESAHFRILKANRVADSGK